MSEPEKTKAVSAASSADPGVSRDRSGVRDLVEPIKDPLDGERDNPKAIRAMMERYDVDEDTATDMWNRFIDTVAKLRERAKASGKI